MQLVIFSYLFFLVEYRSIVVNILVLTGCFIIEKGTADETYAPAAVLYINGGCMNYTYMVKCADGTFYTGWTNSLLKRMKAHNKGKYGAKYTRNKRPVELVYYEGFRTKKEAMKREYEIKQLSRKDKMELMNFGYPTLR